MQCEMCGAAGEMFKTNVEGAVITVCAKCARYGKIIERVKPAPIMPTKAEVERKARMNKIETETLFVITPDYPTLIKSMREKMGLKQEELAKKLNERESSIHKLETGVMEPNIPLARKLEKFFGIRLVEEHKEENAPLPKAKEGEVTLGDFAKIKKR